MNTLGWINQEEYSEAMKYTPNVYDETLTQNKAPYIIDYVLKELSNEIKDIKTGGYKIYLTVDLDAQEIAKEGLKFAYNQILSRDKYFQELNKKIKLKKSMMKKEMS